MFIETVSTPNPNTLKFIPGCEVMPGETKEYKNSIEAEESPLAIKIFSIDGVSGVFFANDFITVTKSNFEWPQLKPIILGEIMEHFLSKTPLITGKAQDKKKEFYNSEDSLIVDKIKELIETRVRPAVAHDGGDITFQGFKAGIVYLNLQGACAGCPSSTMTLKNGIENLLKHYVPEVMEVEAI
ncbi:MAG: NifU family protein [Hyphomicrobiales bacterium]|jgi:Fe-S cluster biogenesis protein NfuA|nr:NifU family protein [Hyphomicrobiales bacterium]|tara:strand:- start:315 stop:866 length:552 start_codon:yes stop_codon:yes gene_type:complete